MTHHSILYREQKRKYRKQKYLNKVKKKAQEHTKKNPTYTQKYLNKVTKKKAQKQKQNHIHTKIFLGNSRRINIVN